MTTYTTAGFPVNVTAGSERLVNGVYTDSSVDNLIALIRCEQTLSFDQKYNASVKATTIWVETGGLFNPAVLKGAKITATARSFIMETAGILSGRLTRRSMGWSDWRLLLCPGDAVVVNDPNWTTAELEELRSLQATPTPVLIQRWVNQHGVGDLIQALGLFVSPTL